MFNKRKNVLLCPKLVGVWNLDYFHCKPQLGLNLSSALKCERKTRGQGSTLQPSIGRDNGFVCLMYIYRCKSSLSQCTTEGHQRNPFAHFTTAMDIWAILRFSYDVPYGTGCYEGNGLKALRKRIQRDYAAVDLRCSDNFANVNEERRHKAITAQRG